MPSAVALPPPARHIRRLRQPGPRAPQGDERPRYSSRTPARRQVCSASRQGRWGRNLRQLRDGVGSSIFTFGRNRGFVAGRQVWTSGRGAAPSYPHLFVDEPGVLHFAMSTADEGDDIPYETIRYLKSLDGGSTWKTMDRS